MDAARQGDPVATEIVREQGRRLAFYAWIAARKVGLASPSGAHIPVIMSGSILMDPDSPVAAALLEQSPRVLPGADPRRATLPPVAGAALDALAEGGVTITPAVIQSLESTIPPSSFFRT
jgi:hypothetical protein